jgi:uncharacterized membrane protein YozB (DUF420 family)
MSTLRTGFRRWPLAVFSVVVVAMVIYLVHPYLPPDPTTSRVPVQGWRYVLLVAHIGTAAIATLAGVAQFWPRLRSRFPVAHRWTGRVYLFAGVFPSSLLAIPVATLVATVGTANQAGLLAMDALWMGTAIAGYRAARQHRYADHRRWMIRNFAVTFSSLATRLTTVVFAMITLPQGVSSVYQGDKLAMIHDMASGSVWTGLLACVLAAEWHIQRRYGVPSARSIKARSAAAGPATVEAARPDPAPVG